jgi:hypothetical protein
LSDQKLYDVDPEWSPERKEAFGMYRDMGAERNLRGVAQALNKSATLIARWSTEDKWRIRVAAWDAEQDRQAQQAAIDERKRIAKKHASALEDTITVLMQPGMKLADKINEEGADFLNDADPIMLANLAAAAGKQLPALIQASRLVHGFSTANVDVHDVRAREIEGASPDELDAYLLGHDDGADEIIASDPTLQLPSKSSGDEDDDVIDGTVAE